MASSDPYADPETQMGGGTGLYAVNQNGGTSPAQQQQHMHTDPDLQLRENLQQLQRNTEMMHPAGPSPHQMNALNPAHHQFQTPPQPTHSPQQMAQSVMSLEEHNMYGDHDASSRKRSKVSRACDECRRKKIRCDATSENGPEACSSCKRTGARCQFSRQPMKRGPSKGYIKELADRLNTLESQIQPQHQQHPQHAHNPPAQPFDFTQLGDGNLVDVQPPFSRKRTHSVSEGFQEPYPRSSWSGQDREYPPPPPNGTMSGLNRRTSFGEMTLAGNLITGSNEGILKAYHTLIHPALPILPHEVSSLNRLTHCPPKLREAFFQALDCAVRPYASRSLPPMETDLHQWVVQCFDSVDAAKQTLNDGDTSHQFYNKLVYCQSLLFLGIASDRPGPTGINDLGETIGRIAPIITSLGLNNPKCLATLREQDYEAFEASRRIFWSTFILDRFRAFGRSEDLILPLPAPSLSRDDFRALGKVGFHLARVADIVGQLAFINRAAVVSNFDPSSPFLQLTAPVLLNGQLARFKETLDLEDLAYNSLPHLADQYVRIIAAKQSDSHPPTEILSLTQELLGHLKSGIITPLNHVFASLVATSLTELSDRVETQVEAHASIKDFDDALSNGNIVHQGNDFFGWDTAIRDLLRPKKALTPPAGTGPEQTSPSQPNMAGLQHLAAAAVGEREGSDARPASSGGNEISAPTESETTKVEHDLTAAVAAANEAAKAQATAAAAQQQMQTSTNGNGF